MGEVSSLGGAPPHPGAGGLVGHNISPQKVPATCDSGGPRLPEGWERARETCLRVSQFLPISLRLVCVCVCVCVCVKEGPEDGEVALERKEGERRGGPQGTKLGRGQGQSVSQPLTL